MRSSTTAVWAAMLSVAGATAPAAPPKPADPPPILTRHPINNREWTLRVDLWLYGIQAQAIPQEFVFEDLRFNLASVDLMFPRIAGSAMHDVHPDGSKGLLDTTVVRRAGNAVNSSRRILDDGFAIASGYQGPTELLIWHAEAVDARYLRLQVQTQMTSYETRIDEQRAFDVPWPPDDHAWTPEIAANLNDQLYVRPDAPEIKRLINHWTNRNPRKAPPYYLAKYLAGRVVEHVQPTGGRFETDARVTDRLTGPGVSVATPLIAGFRVNGSTHAAREGQGSPYDLACLLTAVYRAAGFPARMVIGYDVEQSRRLKAPRLRAWTEFYLYDHRIDRGEWIPVDIERQREFSSVAPPIDQRWEFFGHNEEFDFVAPIAFHWVPPASVTVPGAPAFWGWVTEPRGVLALQDIRFDAMETPMTAGPDGKPQRVR